MARIPEWVARLQAERGQSFREIIRELYYRPQPQRSLQAVAEELGVPLPTLARRMQDEGLDPRTMARRGALGALA